MPTYGKQMVMPRGRKVLKMPEKNNNIISNNRDWRCEVFLLNRKKRRKNTHTII